MDKIVFDPGEGEKPQEFGKRFQVHNFALAGDLAVKAIFTARRYGLSI